MCSILTTSHEEKPPQLRTRSTKQQVEEAAQLASFAVGLAKQLVEEHAVPAMRVEDVLLRPVRNCDANLMLELQAHLHEKLVSFTLMDIPRLRHLVETVADHHSTAAFAQSGKALDTVTIAAGALEQHEWELVMKKRHYD